MTKCTDNARRSASAAYRNGVGVLWRIVRGLGGLSVTVPMQMEFGQENGTVQRRRFHGRAALAGRGHAGAGPEREQITPFAGEHV